MRKQIPLQIYDELQAALENPGVRVRKVTGPNAGTRITRGGYPCITNGVLGWTDDPTDPRRLLFTTPGGTAVQHTNFYERIFRPTVVKLWPAGHRLHGLRYHDLRHTAAALSLAADPTERGLFVVMVRLGHRDIRTTINAYGHLLPSVDVEHASKLSAIWKATKPAGGGTPVPDPGTGVSNVFQLHPKTGSA